MITEPGLRSAILNKIEDSIDFLDMKTRRFLGAISLPPHPHELVLSPDGQTAYASIYGDGVYGNNVHPGHEVVVVDLAAMTSIGAIDLHPYSGPHGMAIHPDGSLFVTCDKSNATLVVDPQSGRIIEAIEMPSHGGHFLTMAADGAKAYVSNKDTAFLSVIDTAARWVCGRVDVPEGSEGIALSPDGTQLYAMSHMGSPLPNKDQPTSLSFYVIDTATDTVVQQVALPDLPELPIEVDHESRICSTPNGKYLLVSAFKWNAVVIIDAATLTPVKTLVVEAEPMNFDFSPDQADMAFVANHRAGRVSRIDLKSLRIAESFLSASSPRTGRPESIAFYRSTGETVAVIEVTSFEVCEGSESAFQHALTNALPILMRQSGYIGHEFGASVERPGLFWLIVHWERLEDHTEGFRKSAAFEIFVGAFRPFLAKPTAVSHFRPSERGDGG